MKRIKIYTITGITCLLLSTFGVLYSKKNHSPKTAISGGIVTAESLKMDSAIAPLFNKVNLPKVTQVSPIAASPKQKKEAAASTMPLRNKKSTEVKAQPPQASTKKPIVTNQPDKSPKKVTIKDITLKKVAFEQLPGWNNSGVKNSLSAFQRSCGVFLKRKPTHPVGSQLVKLKAKDWLPACQEALSIHSITEPKAKSFFEKWFYPLELVKRKPIHGLFTGYYMPLVKGNLTRTPQYNTPIYGVPKNLNWNSSTKFYTRQQIDKGALNKQAPIIAWIHSPVDRLFLEIEGAGVIKLASGKNLYLGYAGENGAPYTSIGNVLIKNGIMTRHTASKQAIQRYFKSHPTKINTILQKNKSFVFFENLKQPMAVGAQDITLTPGYSLAIDKRWIPLGSPLWLTTKKPLSSQEKSKQFQRLMIAQDTGGAIRGLMRGDIYWGSGKNASFLGENMKNEGRYWLFLPKHIFDKLATMVG